MRAREFISEGPLGAIAGGIARGVGKAAGVAAQVGKNFGKAAIKGATSGRVDLDRDSLGATLVGALGFDQTANALQGMADKKKADGISTDIGEPPVDKQAAARNIQGKDIDLPPLGKVKVNRVTPNEIELDTSNTGLGVGKVKLNPKDLQKVA